MKRYVKRSLAFGLSLMIGIAASMGGCDFLYGATVDEIYAAKSDKKLTASGINILDYENNVSATEYVVNDVAGMNKLAELIDTGKEDFLGKTITLIADLKYEKKIKNNYKVIGSDNKHLFRGTFDGGFHTISGVNISLDSRFVGLFGIATGDGKISKIILKNSSIVSLSKDDGLCGGIIGSFGENGGGHKRMYLWKRCEGGGWILYRGDFRL